MTADIRPIKTAAESGLAEAFIRAKSRLPGRGDVAARRESAFRRFEAQGLPHRRVEEWKYTDLRALMRDAKPLAAPPDAAAKARAKTAGHVADGIDARRLVFVDGAFVPEASDLSGLEPGLSIRSLSDALAQGDAEVVARLTAPGPADTDVAAALNTAFMGDGAVIRVARHTRLAQPIHLVFVHGNEASAVFTRSVVVVEEGAALTLIESHEGPDGVDYQVNNGLDLAVGDGARLEHVKIGTEGSKALHVSTLTAQIGARAQFSDLIFTTGGAVTRNQLFVRCGGTDSELGLRGATLLKGRQHADATLVLDHAVGGCNSRELFKSVLEDESRSVFQGKIVVQPHAQKTDARMMTQALLLSETAEADNKPELEIFADDVQCGHGATAGALDDELKFYLMARGIPEKEAESLLIQAFIGEAVDGIEHEGLKEALMAAVVRWLEARA
ncbi:MAG TPA: Fe-S cluster assembly protein SufD [Xanthobacteraceae bacterium]|nr:Fe-S cluster assembly protein SufD [Xanthobacteraceae bacterium]